MVEHQSKEVVDKMSNELKIQPALQLPRKIVDSIQPVYSVNPEKMINVLRTASKNTTGSLSVFTIPTNRKFFLTNVSLSAMSNVTADTVFYTLTTQLKGDTARTILRMDKLSLTAFSDNIAIDFSFPVELDPGSTIVISHNFSVGASIISSSIQGYEVDLQ